MSPSCVVVARGCTKIDGVTECRSHAGHNKNAEKIHLT
jgi:hypothetical protein